MKQPVGAAPGAAKPFDARALIEELARMPNVVARLREVHRPNRGGRHCRDCRVGAQGGMPVWPCRLCGLADAVQELIDQRVPGYRPAR